MNGDQADLLGIVGIAQRFQDARLRQRVTALIGQIAQACAELGLRRPLGSVSEHL